MLSGVVKRWIDDKGFGFIAPDNGDADIFVHCSVLSGGSKRLEAGDEVEYKSEYDERRGKWRCSICTVTKGGSGYSYCGKGSRYDGYATSRYGIPIIISTTYGKIFIHDRYIANRIADKISAAMVE